MDVVEGDSDAPSIPTIVGIMLRRSKFDAA
jgi:hypothetical protein